MCSRDGRGGGRCGTGTYKERGWGVIIVIVRCDCDCDCYCDGSFIIRKVSKVHPD